MLRRPRGLRIGSPPLEGAAPDDFAAEFFRIIEIDLYRTDTNAWTWEALTNRIPNRELTDRLRELEFEGHVIVPVTTTPAISEQMTFENDVVGELPASTELIIGDDQLQQVRELLGSARSFLILTTVWVDGSRNNDTRLLLVQQDTLPVLFRGLYRIPTSELRVVDSEE